SFNLCVPIIVKGFRSVIIHFPLLYYISENPYPSNNNEKVLCKASIYTWI
ncbi:hypothetical protein ASPZODRAFT_70791, partial [Penicilliopsis zonata CBS 506.65]